VRLGKHKGSAQQPVALPQVSDTVTLCLGGGAQIPARVLECGADGLLVAITVPTRPMSPGQLQELVLESVGPRGRIRLRGTVVSQDASEPDLVRIESPRAVEMLQEREYVRISSARPVVVLGASARDQWQSFTVDVSGGGLLLAGPDTLRVGEQVSFRLTLTPGVSPVSGTGRVVRVDRQGRRAVEFEQISDLDRRRLVRFIFECQRAERRRGLDADGGRV
jgi:hypothetical protein